ncbi:gamma-glutamyl-gamma-aminobutyrate hydrolase family protein [Frankia sp. AgPm24]|uniref:gamma-glutamyl-gamma-aminobutyrate hydrolase family protein n=1 Tax=Frankia sp. AgPm24 TaxID=631128 RepID=UPI00200BB8B8|nr:gamma-glutamyl-gamma-aminobutyrate hydrolase family protein [Frankia sp. AgPm24]MCK9921715.1 gamma-glutamyl-gamma-aminobutyrate hydrolase family protein [Frankia sp. AgPm24]
MLATVLGETVIVPCHHHQAIDELGAGLRATGHADDGVVEAVELDGYPFTVAVQWHAEADPDSRLFFALTSAAAARNKHG